MIRIFFNPLDSKSVVEYPITPGTQLIDFLQSNYPSGFDGALRVFVGIDELDLADLDYEVQELDSITMLVMPSGAGFLPAAGAILIQALVAAAIGYVISLIFAPKTPSFGDEPSESLVYTLNPTRNAIRLGEPIQSSYGTCSFPPPFGSAPYSFYWEGSNDQYVDELLVLGQGKFAEITPDDIFIGDTPLSSIADGSVRYWVFDSDFHQQQMGRIGDYITAATAGGYAPWPFYENVYTSPEVSELNFDEAQNDEAGPVAISGDAYAGGTDPIYGELLPGRIEGVDRSLLIKGGDTIVLSGTVSNNITFVVGSVAPDPDNSLLMTVYQQWQWNGDNLQDELGLSGTFITNPADAAGDSVGMTHGPFRCQKLGTQVDRVDCDIVFPQGLFRVDGTSGKIKTNEMELEFTYQEIDETTGLPIGTAIVQNRSWISKLRAPLRATVSSGTLPAGHYECSVRRVTPMHDDSRKTDLVTWSALKGNVTIDRNATAYGDVSIICFRLLATNALGEAARSRIRVVATRVLDEGESNNPITVIKDIWTNTNYGMGFSPALLDPAMDDLETFWADPLGPKFSGAYDTKSTGFDSMQAAASFAGAKVVSDGQLTNVVPDRVQQVRHAMFTTANIVRNSLEIIYSFDTDGDFTGNVVEYRDPETFDAKYVYSPEQTASPEAFTLFGCTDEDYAQEMANYLWNVKSFRRKAVKFSTELEGLIPKFGQRIAISHTMPDWGQSGVFVDMIDALTWIVDQPLDWTEDNVIIIRDPQGLPSAPYTVTQGLNRNIVVFTEVPAITNQQGQEPTSYAFGTATNIITDWIVTKVSPKGDNIVQIEGQIYNEEVYVDAPWQMAPSFVVCKTYECDALTAALISLGLDHTYAMLSADPTDQTAYNISLTTQLDLTGSEISGNASAGTPGQGIARDTTAIDTCNGARSMGSNWDNFEGFTCWRVVENYATHQLYRHNSSGIIVMRYASDQQGQGGLRVHSLRNSDNGSSTWLQINNLTGKVEFGYHNAARQPILTVIGDAPIYNGDPNNEEWFVIVFNLSNDGAEGPCTVDYTIKMMDSPTTTYSGAMLTDVVYTDTFAGDALGTDIGGQVGLLCEPGSRVSFDVASLGYAFNLTNNIAASAADILIEAWEQNKSTYFDPRPACTPCKTYECDALLLELESKDPLFSYRFDQGGDPNTTILASGRADAGMGVLNATGQDPDGVVNPTAGIDPCGVVWNSGSSSGTYKWQDQSLAGGYPALVYPAQSGSVTIGQWINPAVLQDTQLQYGCFITPGLDEQGSYHYINNSSGTGQRLLTAAWINGFLEVNWIMDDILSPEEDQSFLYCTVTMDVTTDVTGSSGEFKLYINGVKRGPTLTDTTADTRKPEAYYFSQYVGGNGSMCYGHFMDDRVWSEGEMLLIAEAIAQSASDYVDPRVECVASCSAYLDAVRWYARTTGAPTSFWGMEDLATSSTVVDSIQSWTKDLTFTGAGDHLTDVSAMPTCTLAVGEEPIYKFENNIVNNTDYLTATDVFFVDKRMFFTGSWVISNFVGAGRVFKFVASGGGTDYISVEVEILSAGVTILIHDPTTIANGDAGPYARAVFYNDVDFDFVSGHDHITLQFISQGEAPITGKIDLWLNGVSLGRQAFPLLEEPPVPIDNIDVDMFEQASMSVQQMWFSGNYVPGNYLSEIYKAYVRQDES